MLLKDYSASNYRGTKSLSNAILNWLVNWVILVVVDVYSFGMLLIEITSRRRNLNTHAKRSSNFISPFGSMINWLKT